MFDIFILLNFSDSIPNLATVKFLKVYTLSLLLLKNLQLYNKMKEIVIYIRNLSSIKGGTDTCFQ